MFRTTLSCCRATLLLLLLLCGVATARAQEEAAAPFTASDRLINLDTPVMPARGALTYSGDLRVFGAKEDMPYGTLQLGYGLRDNMQAILRATLGDTKSYNGPGATIRHGGHDIEALLKYRMAAYPNLAAMLGVSLPGTPAQDSAVLTGQLLYQYPLASASVLHLGAKAVFVKDNPLVGIGGGMDVRVSGTLHVLGDVTALISGNNTRSGATGATERTEVWGLALRWTPQTTAYDLSVDLGITNGVGGTTGFSLTPGLAGSAALYLGVTLRR